MNKFEYVLTYFVCINIASFILFFLDKEKAKRDRWRIPEKTLHSFSFMGGVFGSIAAMTLFHHKTKKPVFVVITIIALLFNIFIYYKTYEYLMLFN